MVRLLCSLAVPWMLFAQHTTGSIQGRVLDTSGGAIGDVEVTVTRIETGDERRTLTRSDGIYVFPDLNIGSYALTALHAGFKKAVENGLKLHVSERLGIDITLEIGEITQEVTVTAVTEQVQTETGDQSSLISGQQVRDLQLNGRSFFTLLELIPGVTSNMADRSDPNSGTDVSVNGARSSASSVTVDGGNNSAMVGAAGPLNTFTSVETIAEFTVVTSPYSAEFGRSGFSQVNVVTRSGSKVFQFGLFEFLRNDAFDASDYFSHQTLPLKLNNFGYNIGGPVILPRHHRVPGKTFFFWAQEFNRITNAPAAVNAIVPTVLERAGDFTPLGPGGDRVYGTADDPVIDPSNGNLGFPGGRIPTSRLDANSKKLIDLYPLPNFMGSAAINFTSAAASRQTWHEDLARVDHTFSNALKVYGRYTQDAYGIRNPYGGPAISSVNNRFPGLASTFADRPGKHFVLKGIHNMSNSLIQQFQFTLSRRYYDLRPAAPLADREQLGITLPELFPENDGNVIPGIVLGSNYAPISPYHVGHAEFFNLEFSDNVSKVYRRHNIKLGGIYSYGGNREQLNNVNTGGTFSFGTNFTRNPVANFLAGYPNQYPEVEKTVVSDARFAMFEAYLQDDWRVNPQLTFGFGLRYSNYYNPYDLHGVMTNFIPGDWDAAKAPQVVRSSGVLVAGTGDPLNGIVVQGKNSPFGKRIVNDNLNLLGPRFSFAWAPFRGRRTSIRGGWGMFYTRGLIGSFVQNAINNPPFSRTVSLNQPSYTTLAGTEIPASPPALTATGLPLKAPTVHRFSLGIQQQVLRRSILDVSYVGTRGLRLLRPVNINSPIAGSVPAGVNVNAIRPYIGYGAIDQRQTSGGSIYHSLQVSLNRRTASGFSYGFAYTWSKSIDDASSDRNPTDQPPDSHNTRAERGPSDFDRTHVFTANFIFTLPSLKRTPLLRGWQLSGIVREWTGTPFDVSMSLDVAGIGGTQNQRPDVIGNTHGPQTAEQWFNIFAFSRPRNGTFGNMSRNSLRGPGVNKWDLALLKNFEIAERWKAQFRAEFFNAFNHPSFTAVATTLPTTATGVNPLANGFGAVTGTRDARVMQAAVKVYF